MQPFHLMDEKTRGQATLARARATTQLKASRRGLSRHTTLTVRKSKPWFCSTFDASIKKIRLRNQPLIAPFLSALTEQDSPGTAF